MNQFLSLLLALIISSILISCGSNSSATTSPAFSWQVVGNSSPIPNIAFNGMAISSNGVVYAGGSADVNNGIVLSNTAALGNWQLVGNNYTPMPLYESVTEQIGSLAVSSTNVIYAAVNTAYSTGTVLYSDPNSNAGAWQPINEYFKYGNVPDNGIINALAVDNTNTVYVATAANYSISNNQISYKGDVYSTQVSNLYAPPKQIGLGSAPDHGVMNAVLIESGIVYAASGGYTIASDGSSAYFGNVYSADSDGVEVWQQVGGGSTPDNGVANSITLANDKNSIYVATSKGNVYKSAVESGGTWSTALGGDAVPDGSAINSITIANNGTVFVATTLGNVYSLTQNNHWQQIGGGTVPDNWSINAIAVYGTQLYAATQGGHVYTIIFP